MDGFNLLYSQMHGDDVEELQAQSSDDEVRRRSSEATPQADAQYQNARWELRPRLTN